MPGVLVFCEVQDGKLKKASREALTIGRKLAEKAGGDVIGVVAGGNAKDAAADAGKHGAKKLYVAGGLDAYLTEPYAALVKQVVDDVKPSIILFGGSSNGRDLAPRLAARLNAGVASDVDRLDWVDGKLRARRPVYSGKAFATVDVISTPAIATCRPNAFPAEEAGGGAAEVVDVNVASSESKTKLIETKTPEAGELSIAEADIIVSGGRGLKEATNFSYIRDLAERSVRHARPSTQVGSIISIRSDKQAASSARISTSPQASRARFSTLRACRRRSTSSRSTKIPKRRSFASLTWASLATSSRFYPPLRKK